MSSESRSLSASSLVSVLVPQAIRDLSAYEVSHPPGITIKLDANESPYPLPEEIQSALGVALGKTALHRYPDPGARELRELLAKENEVAPEQIVFGTARMRSFPY